MTGNASYKEAPAKVGACSFVTDGFRGQPYKKTGQLADLPK